MQEDSLNLQELRIYNYIQQLVQLHPEATQKKRFTAKSKINYQDGQIKLSGGLALGKLSWAELQVPPTPGLGDSILAIQFVDISADPQITIIPGELSRELYTRYQDNPGAEVSDGEYIFLYRQHAQYDSYVEHIANYAG
jgi:hypothetical protein